MADKIVASFDKDLKKIEFYEIAGNYRSYTLLRKQGTASFYIYDNKFSLLSNSFKLETLPIKRKEFIEVISNVKEWFFGTVFFWGDSKFVTEFGLPHYDTLLDIYKQLITIKEHQHALNQAMYGIGVEDGIFIFIRYKLMFKKFMRKQTRSIKMLIKEFKVIW